MTTIPPEPPGPPSDGDDNRPPAPPSTPVGSSAPPPPPPPPPADGGYAPPAPPAGGYVEPPPGYGAPAPGGYGAQAPGGYGAPAPGGYTGPPMAYAEWPQRVLSALIDTVGPFIVASFFYYGVSRPLGAVIWLAAVVWGIYNAYLGGQTGQSYGKKIIGTRLVLEATGQPPGGGLGIGRYFLHIVDSIPCYVGYLWPLWDSKKQTFADKLLKTVVVTA